MPALPQIRTISVVLLSAALAGCAPAASPGPTGSTNPSATSVATAAPSAAAALPLVIDTDMAADDLTAIASLLRDPAVDLRAITVSGTGEAHCPGGMFVARALVTMLRDTGIPVTCGNASPLAAAEPFPTEWRQAADAGNGLTLVSPAFVPDDRPAPQLLVELATAESAAGGRLTILTLGTMTNVATALALDPSLPSKVRLVSMLGAVGVPGNVTTQPGDPTAEWNAHADPTAVRRVLEGGFDWTLVPLDATQSVPITQGLFDQLASDHAAGPADLVFELWARNPYMTQSGFYLWDPLAAAVVRDPTIVTLAERRLSVVEGDGLDGGALRSDAAGHTVSVATSADRSRFEAFLLERLRIGPPRTNAFTEVGSVTVTGGAGTCQATLEPATPSSGLLRIRVTNSGSEPIAVAVFELAKLTWVDVEASVANYDPTAPPPAVTVIAQLSLDAGASGTAYGTSPAGALGVACFSGAQDAPRIRLAGPFPVGP